MNFRQIMMIILCCCLFVQSGYCISGSSVCEGSSATVPVCANGFLLAYPGGIWTTSDSVIATVDPTTGAVAGHHAGTVTITYTQSDACGTHIFSYTLTVNPLPAIFGPASVCLYQSVNFTGTPTGGVWTSSSPIIASIGYTTGIATGNTVGSVSITYTLPTGCALSTPFSVYALPAPITGAGPVCVGHTLTLSDATSGGTWSSNDSTKASVGLLTGVVTGIAPGAVVITYTSAIGCSVSVNVLVNAAPAPITGPSSVCVGSSVTLSDITPGGAWQSSNPAIASISSSGVVTGDSAGSVTISYGLPTGCLATMSFVVNPSPAPISGPALICLGHTGLFTDATPGGAWSSSDPLKISINTATGVANGLATGSATITYTAPGGCYTTMLVSVVTAFDIHVCETMPIATCVSPFTFCGSGFTITVTGAPAGSTYNWSPAIGSFSSSHDSISGGILTTTYTFTSGVSAGVYNFTISSSASCGTPAHIAIVVPTGNCSPCQAFHPSCASCTTCTDAPAFKTITATTLDSFAISPTVPNYYYINNDANLLVSPAPGSVMVMGKDVVLRVPGGANIVLGKVHLLSPLGCRWDGISVDDTSVAPGQLTVKNNTLIENAYKTTTSVLYKGAAISIVARDPSALASCIATFPATGNILTSDNVIYNNNNVGIAIYMYSNQNTMPFEIKGSVFTNRDFSCFHVDGITGATGYYPFVWPTATYLKTQNLPVATPNNPRLNIDDYQGIPPYPGVVSDGIKYGMDLLDVGKTDFGSPNVYHLMSMGDSLSEGNTNLFDTLQKGIVSTACNISCYNNIFRCMVGYNYGIEAALNTGTSFANMNCNSLRLLSGATANTHNRFYNCSKAVTAEVYNLEARNTLMRNTNVAPGGTTPYAASSYGYYLNDSAFDSHHIISDTFYNIYTGIHLQSINYHPVANGDYVISNNRIYGQTSATSSENAYYSINVDRSACTFCTTVNGTLFITNNNIIGNPGGLFYNANDLNTSIDNNSILIRDNPWYTPNTGIEVTQSANVNSVSGNSIAGDVANGVTFNTPACSYSSHAISGTTAIYVDNVTNTMSSSVSVSCNTIKDVPIGFKFTGISSLSWTKNVMTRDRIGMLLQGLYGAGSEARIGNQGDTCHPIDNKWDGAVSGSWLGWGAYIAAIPGLPPSDSIFQTFILEDDATTAVSNLNVRSDGGSTTPPFFTPTHNGGTGYASAPYSIGSTVLIAGTCAVPYVPCAAPPLPPEMMMHGSGTGAEDPAGIGHTQYGTGQLSLFPNPTRGILTIQGYFISEVPAVKIEILDMTGRVITEDEAALQDGYISKDISLGKQVDDGVYLLKISAGSTNRVLRFTLAR